MKTIEKKDLLQTTVDLVELSNQAKGLNEQLTEEIKQVLEVLAEKIKIVLSSQSTRDNDLDRSNIENMHVNGELGKITSEIADGLLGIDTNLLIDANNVNTAITHNLKLILANIEDILGVPLSHGRMKQRNY